MIVKEPSRAVIGIRSGSGDADRSAGGGAASDAAGIPRASQVILAGTLVTFGLPVEGVLLIMGVDELMDMARTTVNLLGNSLSTAVVARWEGEFRTQPVEAPALK